MNKRYLGLLSAGHFFTDVNQGALPAILPFLIADHNLSYAEAAALVFAANMASSVVQPLFGHLADRISSPWLMPAGILFAGLGLSLIGFLENYWLLFAAATISGTGIAAFHPEAARLANRLSGEKKATGVSLFAVGGNAGFAVGPIVTTAALLAWGLKGTLILIFPVIIMSALLALKSREFHSYRPSGAGTPPAPAGLPAPEGR